MDATGIIFAARDLGVRLSATPEDNIEYWPKSRMTPGALAELAALDRGACLCANRLTKHSVSNEREERRGA